MFERALWADWQCRINSEIEYRKLQRQKMSYAIQESGKMVGTRNIEEATMGALITSRKAGVLSANTASEYRELLAAYDDYRKEMGSRLL